MSPPRISVVIPVLNERDRIHVCLEQFEDQERPCEIIVVDGGSRDGTPEAVSEFKNVRLLKTEPGRGRQLHAGSRLATGDLFLFLHADTMLPPEGFRRIREGMIRREVVGGAFRLRHEGSNVLYRAFFPFIMWRSWLPQALPYGDQAIFCSSRAYFKSGGYPPFPIMEDYEFARRLRRQGRLIRLNEYVTGSFRRFDEGTLRYVLRCNLTFLLYRFGVPSTRLNRFYHGGEGRTHASRRFVNPRVHPERPGNDPVDGNIIFGCDKE